LIRSKSDGAGQFRDLIADKGYFQEYFHTLLAQKLIESGYKLRRTDRGWHQWEMACITDRELELFSKRNELIEKRENRHRTKKAELRAMNVIARQQSFSTARRKLRIGVSKWDRSAGTQFRQK
jgi:TrwC relaxase